MRDLPIRMAMPSEVPDDHDTQDGARMEPKAIGSAPRPATEIPGATFPPQPNRKARPENPSPKGGRGHAAGEAQKLIAAPQTPDATARSKPHSATHLEPHPSTASIHSQTIPSAPSMEANPPAANWRAQTRFTPPQEELIDGGHQIAEVHLTRAPVDNRFTDPLICEIVETWRSRQDMVRAQSKTTQQIKAICRRYCAGDKKEADKLYAAIAKGMDHPRAASASMACTALFISRQAPEEARKGYEKHLTKLGKQLPIAHMADQIKGIGHLALAKIVGECGDLSAYKSVAAVWKRAGLAVVNGERQRRKSDAELALLHGYSPERRSTFWNIADALLKAQGKDENAGPYRQYYDAEKARQIDKECSKAQAHNRAMRHMTKRLLKDLVLEWRRIAAE